MVVFFSVVCLLGLFTLIAGFVMLIVSFINKKPMKRVLIVMGTGAAVALVSFGIAVATQMHADKVEAARIAKQEAVDRAERKAKNKKFNAGYSVFIAGAYSAASGAEDLGKKVQSTWSDAIFEDNGATVAGKQYTDFSDAIHALIANEKALKTKISNGTGTMTSGLNTMSDNVTIDTKTKLQKAIKIAKKVDEFSSMTTAPTGSYQTYGTEIAKLDSETADLISEGFDIE